MNTRVFGITIGSVGVLLLFVALILGIVMGVNNQTQVKWYQDDEDVSEGDYDSACETEELLLPMTNGIAGFGTGLLFIGIGLALAGSHRWNIVVLIIAIVAFIVIFAGLILHLYEGMINQEHEKLSNKDRRSDNDDERMDEIEITGAFIDPFKYYLSGFLFDGLGIGLTLATMLVGAFVAAGSGEGYEHVPVGGSKEAPLSSDLYSFEGGSLPKPQVPSYGYKPTAPTYPTQTGYNPSPQQAKSSEHGQPSQGPAISSSKQPMQQAPSAIYGQVSQGPSVSGNTPPTKQAPSVGYQPPSLHIPQNGFNTGSSESTIDDLF